jgi:formylmethanofuran dehydrogenase subunit E
MINPHDYLEMGFKFHGHKCPAMPLGLKSASLAMNTLGVEHSQAGELFAILDLGKFHCAGCFADGVQIITGCTYGKGNILRTNKGKFSFTLIDRKTGRGVKITPIGSWLKKALQSPFMEERKKGTPPQNISREITDPLVDKVINMPYEQQFKVEKFDSIHIEMPPHYWDKDLCEKCGELTVAEYAHYINGKYLCSDCAKTTVDILGTRRQPFVTLK